MRFEGFHLSIRLICWRVRQTFDSLYTLQITSCLMLSYTYFQGTNYRPRILPRQCVSGLGWNSAAESQPAVTAATLCRFCGEQHQRDIFVSFPERSKSWDSSRYCLIFRRAPSRLEQQVRNGATLPPTMRHSPVHTSRSHLIHSNCVCPLTVESSRS